MYQIRKKLHKTKPILEIGFLIDSGATLNLLHEDTCNAIKYNNPETNLEKANKTLRAANNTTIETIGTVKLEINPERVINSRKKKPQITLTIYCYITQCNHNIPGTPVFKEFIVTINVNTKKLTINTNAIVDNDITFFMSSTIGYPYYSRIYPIYNKEPICFKNIQHKCITFPIPILPRMEKLNGKVI